MIQFLKRLFGKKEDSPQEDKTIIQAAILPHNLYTHKKDRVLMELFGDKTVVTTTHWVSIDGYRWGINGFTIETIHEWPKESPRA